LGGGKFLAIKLRKIKAGFTLSELIIAMLFSSIMIIGTLGFSYYSQLNVQKADLYNTSVEIAELVLNDWQAAGGASSYDPIKSLSDKLDITVSETSLCGLENILGSYQVALNGNVFLLTLSHREPVEDKPKLINVVVDWVEEYRSWELSDSRQSIKLSKYIANSK
jgi:hypothetical protein